MTTGLQTPPHHQPGESAAPGETAAGGGALPHQPAARDPRMARYYRGFWGMLTRWLKVPAEPPHLPGVDGAALRVVKPSRRWLSYLRLQWLGKTVILGGAGLAFGLTLDFLDDLPEWLHALIVVFEVAAYVGAIPALYLAIHLRYDATWYIMSDRSLCIRRGIWTIRETTLTFENVQNVAVSQGPVQRWFGIADVILETAGGGKASGDDKDAQDAHRGRLEGIEDVEALRDLLMSRIRTSRTAGLGDEPDTPPASPTRPAPGHRWSEAHLAVLRAIRDDLAANGVRSRRRDGLRMPEHSAGDS